MTNKANDVLFMEHELESKMTVSDDMPHLGSVNYQGTVYSVGTIDENMLSEEEKATINKFVNEIDISNIDQIVIYGADAQKNISDFSATVLNKVKTYEIESIGDSLKELTVALDATTEPEKKGILGFFQKTKNAVGSVRANYAKAETNVDRIEKDLRSHEAVLLQDISMFQKMYELNLKYYKDLTMYIFAGKIALDSAKNDKLFKLKSIADQTNLQEDIFAYNDFEDLCKRFEKKLSDLEVTRVIAIQSAPQIRMLQNNDREMLDQLQSSIANTIPLWRNQLVLSLGIDHTKRAVEARNVLADKTNELMLKNSATLKMATVDIARASERPIVDISTLNQCNKDLIDSIKSVVEIQEKGKKNRIAIQKELIKIESELKKVMLDEA